MESLTLNPGVGGEVIRVLDDGTYLWPAGITAFATSVADPDVVSIVTPTTGLPVRLADGSGYLATLPVSLASVPSHAVTGPLTDAELRASAIPVSLASVPSHAVTNAGTFAVQAAQTGAWTVDLGATDNAVLDAIAASVAGTLAVSAASLPLPSGASTAANQTTANASLATLAGAVAGTEVQVDVLTMPTVAVTGTFWQATQPVSGTVTVQDGGGSVTVDAPVGTPLFVRLSDGTDPLATLPVSLASVPSHAVTNAGTFAVQAAQSGTWNITNISGTVSLPTGAATAAKQPALGTAGTASADVITVQGVASMTPILVNGSGVTQPVSGTVTAELSATDNAVLDAIAASLAGTLTVTGGGGGTEYTEGATDASITGSAILWEDTGDTLRAVSAAKPLPIGDAGGSLTVDGTVAATQSGSWTVDLGATDNAVLDAIAASVAGTLTVGSHAVTNAGTFAVQAAQSGAWTVDLGATDNAVLDAIAASVAGTLTVGTHAVTQSGTWTVTGTGGTFPVTDSGGSLTVDAPVGTPVFVRLSDGSSAISTLPVSLASVPSHAVTNAGTFAVQAAQSGTWNVGTVTAVTTCSTLTTLTGGGIAHDSADSGNPVKVGARAALTLSDDTMVANADRTDLVSDADGALIVRNDCPSGDLVNGNASNTDGTSTQVIAAQGAGVKTYLTDITITNTSATMAICEIKDGTTVKWTFPVPATGGVTHSWKKPLAGSANTAWNFDMGAATTTAYCSMSGYKSKV